MNKMRQPVWAVLATAIGSTTAWAHGDREKGPGPK